MTTTAPLAAPLPTPILAGNDFADWLSPILVKELRQGLKSRAFVAIFIVLQVVMILLVGMELLSLAGGAGRGTLDVFDGFFWALVFLPLILFMPARGLTAVSEEVRANTLDLVQLTRLTAFRIVLGKWVALVSQTLLLVAAILPYAVLRYFFGDVDIIRDLENIGLTLLGSMLFTAGAIALSTVHLAVRIIVLVVLLPMSMAATSSFAMMSAMGGTSLFVSGFGWTWMPAVMVALYTYLLLEIAASKIAPDAENHSAPKRLLAIGMAAILLVLVVFANETLAAAWMMLSVPAWCWVLLEALSERTVTVPSLYTSFARRGWLGKLAGRFLYPGWATALVFCLFFLGLAVSVFWIMGSNHSTSWEEDRRNMALVFPIAFTAIITPVIFLMMFPRVRQPIWLYILVQAIFTLLFVIAYVATEAPQLTPTDTYRWLAPFPPAALLALWNESENEELRRVFATVTLPVCGIVIIYLALRAAREFRIISNLERESLGKKQYPSSDRPTP